MASIMISCPNTGASIHTGIETDRISWRRLPSVLSTVVCSRCGEIHLWSCERAWLADAPVSGADRRPARSLLDA
jgi:hypothetical protein